MTGASGRGPVIRMFGSALGSQMVLSAASFIVGLLLIRRTADLQYGYYILASSAIALAVSLQNAFIAPSMVNRMTRLDRDARGDLTGGLYRDQRAVVAVVSVAAAMVMVTLWALQVVDGMQLLLLLTATAAMVAALGREYFRMVLMAYRQSHPVLRVDLVYGTLLGLGVLLATITPAPAIVAVLATGLAAGVAGLLLSQALRRIEAWNPRGAPGILREIAPLGAWSTAGAAIHWTFSQGYSFLVAGTLEVSAVAAVAATRLLAMPVNQLSAAFGSLMLPLAARWLEERGASLVLRRLLGFAAGIAAVAIAYFTVLWLLRDLVFDSVLHKHFAQRDLLLMLWSACFVIMAVDQQLLWLLIVRERFRLLTALAATSALVALASSYWGMRRFGGAGAPMGILAGELVNTIGVVVLCLREVAPTTASRPLATTTPWREPG